MSELIPFEVGATVKWREGDEERAGVVFGVDFAVPKGNPTGVQAVPIYRILLSDRTEVVKPHPDLVLV